MFLLREGVVIKQYFDDTLFFPYPNVCVGWISLERQRAINYRICQGLCRPLRYLQHNSAHSRIIIRGCANYELHPRRLCIKISYFSDNTTNTGQWSVGNNSP